MIFLKNVAKSLCLALLPVAIFAAESKDVVNIEPARVGIVSVRACVEQSKEGQTARDSLENLNKSLTKSLDELSKKLEEINIKLENEDVRDSLAPEAEKALQDERDNLLQEHEMRRMHFSQQMQQAQMAAMQTLFDRVSKASEGVAADLNLNLIIQEDSAFFFSPKLDVTDRVIAVMDTLHTQEAAKKEQLAAESAKEEAKKENSSKPEESKDKKKSDKK